MKFIAIRAFLTSWGLHFDTPDGSSNDIPYPQVYGRMQHQAFEMGGDELRRWISSHTDTTDGRTYLTVKSWEELEKLWPGKKT